MADILIYLVSLETSHRIKKLKSSDSLKVLSKHLKTCSDEVKKNKIDAVNGFHSILAAPEYLFSKYSKKGEREPFEKKEEGNIATDLSLLAQKYPKTIIVAGTIFHRDMIINQSQKKAFFNTLLSKEYKLKFGVGNHLPSKSGKLVPSSNFIYMNYNPSCTTKSDVSDEVTKKNKEILELCKKSNVKPLDPVRNSCYVMLGKTTVIIDKQTGFNETYNQSPNKSIFGSKSTKKCANFRGFMLGVEICFDHANGWLKGDNKAGLDFHVIVSDCVSLENKNLCAAIDGYAIHASSNWGLTTVKKNTKTGYKELKPYEQKGGYKVYKCEVEDRSKTSEKLKIQPMPQNVLKELEKKLGKNV